MLMPVTRCNAAGIALIKEFEGCAFRAYKDMAGIWTIGYGHTTNVQPLQTCTQEMADQWLKEDLEFSENVVWNEIPKILNENQFSALVSFTFNEGPRHLVRSSMKRFLNASPPDYMAAANSFLLWDKVRGCDVPGLLRRRQAERALFCKTRFG